MQYELSIRFYPLRSTRSLVGKLLLELSLNGEKKRYNTGMEIPLKFWDWEKQTIRKNTATYDISRYMLHTTLMLVSAYRQLLKKTFVDVDYLYFKVFDCHSHDLRLLDVFEKHNAVTKSRIGIYCTQETYKIYVQSMKVLGRFLSDQPDTNPRIYFLERPFIEKYYNHLIGVSKLSLNTAHIHIGVLKRVMNYAVEEKLLFGNPFSKFIVPQQFSTAQYLTVKELQRLEQIKIVSNMQQIVRDLFVFQCYTGLSYSDLRLVEKGNLQSGKDYRWLIIKRKKTGIRSAIPLLPKAEEILSTTPYIYQYRKNSVRVGKIFAVPQLRTYNRNVKKIMAGAKINKKVSSHVARKTFANSVAFNFGVSIESIALMMGHSKAVSTYRYTEVSEKKISNEMKAVRKAFSILNGK